MSWIAMYMGQCIIFCFLSSGRDFDLHCIFSQTELVFLNPWTNWEDNLIICISNFYNWMSANFQWIYSLSQFSTFFNTFSAYVELCLGRKCNPVILLFASSTNLMFSQLLVDDNTLIYCTKCNGNDMTYDVYFLMLNSQMPYRSIKQALSSTWYSCIFILLEVFATNCFFALLIYPK